MEVDTGATLSVMSEEIYHRTWKDNPPLITKSRAKLKTYTGETIPVMGALQVDVSHAGQQKQLQRIITMGNGPTLLGRNWLEMFHVDYS